MSQTSFEKTGKEDSTLNGGIRDYTEEGEEVELSETPPKVEELLVSNTNGGYEMRTQLASRFVTYGVESNALSNEVGWILEYYFGIYIVPDFFSIPSILPSASKYESEKEYKRPWDFITNEWSAEIKTQSLTSVTGVKHPIKKYYCQLSKFTKSLPSTEKFYVWWGEIESYDSILLSRECPREWKYFECDQTTWKNKYYINEPNNEKLPGLYFKNGFYNELKKKFEDVLVAEWAKKQAGANYGPQLVFLDKYLKSYTVKVDTDNVETVERTVPINLTLDQIESFDLLDEDEQERYVELNEEGHKHSYILYSILGPKWRKELESRIN
jgi:hypothetical protein